MADPKKKHGSGQTGLLSVSEVYPRYRKYVLDFQANGGPVRDLLTPEEFADFWFSLQETEQAEYFSRFEAGYGSATASRKQGADYIRRHTSPPREEG